MDLRERPPSGTPDPGERHPWEQARATFVLELLRGAVAPGERVLDVGAGDAWLATRLHEELGARVSCWDPHYTDEDLRRLGAMGLEPTQAPPAGPFALALLGDVLEHAQDDAALLADAVARLRPGGRVLVTVPAWPALFSSHDRALHHHRRYTPASLRARLDAAGLVIDQCGGLFHGLLLPRALQVLAERLGVRPSPAGVGRWRGGPRLTRALVTLLYAEQRLSRAAALLDVDVPGLSAWALCTRPLGELWQSGRP